VTAAGALASQRRYFLPKDLAGAVNQLDHVEIDAQLIQIVMNWEINCEEPKGMMDSTTEKIP
jgi:hypothetical protein